MHFETLTTPLDNNFFVLSGIRAQVLKNIFPTNVPLKNPETYSEPSQKTENGILCKIELHRRGLNGF